MTKLQTKRTEKLKMGRVETIARALTKTTGLNPDNRHLGYSPISGEVDGNGPDGDWFYEWRLYEDVAREAIVKTLQNNCPSRYPDEDIPF